MRTLGLGRGQNWLSTKSYVYLFAQPDFPVQMRQKPQGWDLEIGHVAASCFRIPTAPRCIHNLDGWCFLEEKGLCKAEGWTRQLGYIMRLPLGSGGGPILRRVSRRHGT